MLGYSEAPGATGVFSTVSLRWTASRLPTLYSSAAFSAGCHVPASGCKYTGWWASWGLRVDVSKAELAFEKSP